MTIRTYADAVRCVIFEEAPGGGDPLDPASPMNRPVLSPLSWLGNLYFHSALDYYGVAAYDPSISVTHPQIAGIVRSAGGGTGSGSSPVSLAGQSGQSDHLLLQHNLGYVPDFYAIIGGRLIPGGIPVQRQDDFRVRWASVYATTTQIRVRSFGYSSGSALAAIAVSYGVIVFRDHAPIAGEDMLRIAPGDVVFGRGLFRSGEPHLRATGGGGSAFAVATGPTARVRNGGLRAWLPDGSSTDWGYYNGGGSAPGFINVGVGV
jgi:hypothetical protein